MGLEDQKGVSQRVNEAMLEHLLKHHGARSVKAWMLVQGLGTIAEHGDEYHGPAYEKKNEKGVANGYAGLDGSGNAAQDPKTHGSARHTGTIGYAHHQYAFVPDAAPGADVDAGDQQGAIHHSGPDGDTATRLYVDCETAPGTSVVVTVQYGNTDDLDTVASWTTIATITASGKTSIQNSMSNAAIPASRLVRMNVGTITGTDPKDMTVTLRTKRAVTAT